MYKITKGAKQCVGKKVSLPAQRPHIHLHVSPHNQLMGALLLSPFRGHPCLADILFKSNHNKVNWGKASVFPP